MIGLKGKNAKKANSKARILCLFLAVIFILSQSSNIQIVNAAGKVYVDRTAGLNTNSGEDPESAVRTLRKAKELLKGKGTIYVKVGDEWIVLDTRVFTKDKNFTEVPETKTEEPKADEKSNVGGGLDYSTVEEPKVEEPKVEEPEVEEPKTEEPEVKEPKEEESKAEEPKVEEPKTEEPEVEEPKTEEPEVKEPKAEESEAEEPKAEEPKTEEPKTEEPKAEDTTVDDNSVVTEELMIDEDSNVGNTLDHSAEEIPEQLEVEEDQNVENLNKLVSRMTFMVEEPADTDNVEAATMAYEALDEEAKAKVPFTVYKRLRAAQIVASSKTTTVSTPVEIVGNTGDVYEQSGTQSGGNSDNSNSNNSNSGSDNKSTGGEKNTAAAKSVGAKTGDNNNIFMLVGIGVLAVAAVGGLIYFKKKKDKEDEDKESKRP